MSSSNGAQHQQQKHPPRQHGDKGVYYAGHWLDIEDCVAPGGTWCSGGGSCTSGTLSPHEDDVTQACPRSKSRHCAAKSTTTTTTTTVLDGSSSSSAVVQQVYDVCIVGAGCIGAAVARELSKYNSSNKEELSVLWVEAADDVSQGATKGNSGIVHAGYDDAPGSVRAQHCWPGNQMFAALDRDLHFGYQINGSLVLAFSEEDMRELERLAARGKQNGVQNLRIIASTEELRELEPHANPAAVGALYAPDAGNVIPYEFAIAMAENAVDNGVELRIRTTVTGIHQNNHTTTTTTTDDGSTSSSPPRFTVHLEHWEPAEYLDAVAAEAAAASQGSVVVAAKLLFTPLVAAAFVAVLAHFAAVQWGAVPTTTVLVGFGGYDDDARYHMAALLVLAILYTLLLGVASSSSSSSNKQKVSRRTPLKDLVAQAGAPVGSGGAVVPVADMLLGGSGSARVVHGTTVATSQIQCSYIINCAGGASDQIANMIGDYSFKIKPRLGDYILLNRNQGHLAKHTLFPCPDPVLGKGVLVQTTLWGNLILGPTARDTYKQEARDMSAQAVQEYILSQCKKLVPSFDPKETIHAFCGARAKSDRGDWIIEPSKQNPNFIHVAGIDSPGLAGAPSIALKVVDLLKEAGLKVALNPSFNPKRAPIITPKNGMKGLKMGPVGKFDSDGSNMEQMAANVICKCEKVTELEVVRAMRRSLPIDSSQAIRKRTRAGMGHCQGDPVNFNCEARVRAIIARENGVPVEQVGGRPWPATSTLSQRWIDDKEKLDLEERMKK